MEKKKFYICSNNGVTGVITEEVYKEMKRRWALKREAIEEGRPEPNFPTPKPIFTFANLSNHPSLKLWVTGDLNDMAVLLDGYEVEGHNLLFYVPFSNGYEIGIHGQEFAEQERRFHTTIGEAMETFDLSRARVTEG